MQLNTTPEIRAAFRKFLVASLLTMAAIQLSLFIDGLMLSYFSSNEAMASLNLSRPVVQVLYAISVVLGNGGSMLAGVAIGKGNRERANRVFSVTMLAVVAVGLLCTVGGTFFIDDLSRALCSEEEMLPMVKRFCSILLIGAVMPIGSTVLQCFVTVDGAPRYTSLSVIVGSLTLILLDALLVGAMGWGITGAAVATVLSYVAAIVMLMAHFWRKDTLKFTHLVKWGELGQALNVGLPFGVATLLIAVQMWGCNLMVQDNLGASGTVAWSVCMYLLGFSMIFLSGTLKTLQPLASILKGQDNTPGALKVVKYSYLFLVACLAVYVIPQLTTAGAVAWLFSIHDEDSLRAVMEAVPAYAWNIVLQCLMYLLLPVYQLYGNKTLAYVLSITQSVAPMIGMWLMFRHAPECCWYGPAAGQLAVLVIVVAATELKRLRNRNLLPVLLMPKE